MTSRVKITKDGLAFIYSTHTTKAKAETALEDYFAGGEITECELMGNWIERHEGRYAVLVRN